MGWLIAGWLAAGVWALDAQAAALGYMLRIAAVNALSTLGFVGVLSALHLAFANRHAGRLPRARILEPRVEGGRIRWHADPSAVKETVSRRRLHRPALLLALPLTLALPAALAAAAGLGSPRDLAVGVATSMAAMALAWRRVRPGERVWLRACEAVAARIAHDLPGRFLAEREELLDDVAGLRTRLYGSALMNGIVEAVHTRFRDGLHDARSEILTDAATLDILCQTVLDDLRDYRRALGRQLDRRRSRSKGDPGVGPDAGAGAGDEGVDRSASPDDYTLLGVEPDCTDRELRQALIRLALRLHPDQNPDLPSGPLAAVNAAYRRIRAEREGVRGRVA